MTLSYYRGQKFQIDPGVYEPAEDTYLLADNLEMKGNEKVLELGTGCGLLSIIAAKEGANVVATDVSKKAIRCAKKNARTQKIEGKIDFRVGDLLEPIGNEKFDLIIFNPPYLPVPPSEEQNSELDKAWDGGPDGRKIIDRFLDEIENYLKPDGRFIFVQSSLSDAPKTLDRLGRKNFQVQTEVEKFSFEKLYLIKASSKNKN